MAKSQMPGRDSGRCDHSALTEQLAEKIRDAYASRTEVCSANRK